MLFRSMQTLMQILERVIGNVSKNITISIEIDLTKHAEERQTRDINFTFTDADIKKVAEMALPKITKMLMLNTLNVSDEVLIKFGDLNLICTIENRVGSLELVVITVMKKQGFMPKLGTKLITV